ncbi:MAG: CRISPR-associated endoribonuclease Cas6 [Saprospiraceae bacterium]|nr:CRISPR-associated endoribonuclease Cas6 [Saprospiraceae bacterium]
MRIYLKLSANRILVDFNYQVKLVGALHKWLGSNAFHGKQALFSMSWLNGGRSADQQGLHFPNGATWFISAHESEFVKKIVGGILDDPTVAYGMSVTDLTLSDTPHFEGKKRFFLGSPVFVKYQNGGRQHHFTYKDPEADGLLTQSLKHKLRLAGLTDEGVIVQFDRQSSAAKTKLTTYRSIQNRVNFCPVIIQGSAEQLGFAWNVGIGNSTGIGFGSLI